MIHITVIIATFNSEKILPKTLAALVNQNYPKEKMEVLVLDGGSTDKTKSIAKSFGAKIINNPQTDPLHAKYLGYKNAKGKYIMYLDHDEVLENKNSLHLKEQILEANKNIKAVTATGYKNPPNYPIINNYINEFGDPFSFFIYKLSKDARFFISTMKTRYFTTVETKDFICFTFKNVKNLPIIELCAGGSMFDAMYMKKNFPETLSSPILIPHFFYLLHKKSPFLAISKNDAIFHYSSDTTAKYLKKILWRIKNNIYHISQIGNAGFTGREEYLSRFDKVKKYAYLPYAFTLVLPIVDSIYLIVTRKNIFYIIHFPLTLYTAFEIFYHTLLKKLGMHQMLRSYDETKVITNL